jgi:hypothetical protein
VSTDYFVIVPKGRWPSYRALDDAFERQGFPVRIVRPDRSLSGEPVAAYPQSLGLKVLLEGQPVELETGVEAMPAGSDLLTDINVDLEMHRAQRRAGEGDHLLSLVLRSSMEEWIAGCYLMAVLVREFGAHGFETDEGTSGDAEWADLLVKGAECRFNYGEDEAERSAAEPPAAQASGLGIGNLVSIARWGIALAVIAYFAISTWMKADNALERQDAAQVTQP